MENDKIIIETTEKKEIIDITKNVNEIIKRHEVNDGLLYLFLKHTTAALTTGFIDPTWELDIIENVEITVSKPDIMLDQPSHTHIPMKIPDHIISSFIGTSILVPIFEGSLNLGEMQAVILIELNGPQEREIFTMFIQ